MIQSPSREREGWIPRLPACAKASAKASAGNDKERLKSLLISLYEREMLISWIPACAGMVECSGAWSMRERLRIPESPG